ncbi:MAG: cysteine desulfurase [Clostridiales bacterium]|nr:cysteine desulfurase [Clostridiales bacterium]
MSIYFDNSATTKPLPEVARLVYETLSGEESFGNPGSLHRLGVLAERDLNESADKISKLLSCKKEELFFTSCGSESVNTSIMGYVHQNPRAGKKIISTKTEHKASLESLSRLEKEGYEICYLPVLSDGKPDLDALEKELDGNTALLTFTHVNNESGSILPLADIVAIRNKKNRNTKIHLDCVQSLGKLPIALSRMGVDMASFSGHKIHALKGFGLLYIKSGVRVQPLIIGGGQQKGMRSGTQSPYLASAFTLALEKAVENIDENLERMTALRDQFATELQELGATILSPEDALPYVLNVSFPSFQSETMLHCLEEKEIYVSTVSACSSKSKAVSYVLSEMGIRREIAQNAVRFSFSRFNTKEEMDTAITAIHEIYEKYKV